MSLSANGRDLTLARFRQQPTCLVPPPTYSYPCHAFSSTWHHVSCGSYRRCCTLILQHRCDSLLGGCIRAMKVFTISTIGNSPFQGKVWLEANLKRNTVVLYGKLQENANGSRRIHAQRLEKLIGLFFQIIIDAQLQSSHRSILCSYKLLQQTIIHPTIRCRGASCVQYNFEQNSRSRRRI